MTFIGTYFDEHLCLFKHCGTFNHVDRVSEAFCFDIFVIFIAFMESLGIYIEMKNESRNQGTYYLVLVCVVKYPT